MERNLSSYRKKAWRHSGFNQIGSHCLPDASWLAMGSKDHVFGLTSICLSNGIYFITKKLMLTYSLGLQRPRLGGATVIHGQWRSSHCRLPCCKTQVYFLPHVLFVQAGYQIKMLSILMWFCCISPHRHILYYGVYSTMNSCGEWCVVEHTESGT